jgi:hypothetical protein
MTGGELAQTTALLARTPPVLDALLRDLPAEWTHGNEGPGTWSASDVVSHLVHADRTNWMPRVRAIVQADTVAVFEAFDRYAFDSATRPLADWLSEFARVRAASLVELRDLRLQPRDLARRGQHPAAGIVTLSQVLATWATHDLTHLHQIARVMAHQYRDHVGPWSRYLGVLRCDGHGAA